MKQSNRSIVTSLLTTLVLSMLTSVVWCQATGWDELNRSPLEQNLGPEQWRRYVSAESRARNALQEGDATRALQLLNPWIEYAEIHPSLTQLLGVCFLQDRNWIKAREYMELRYYQVANRPGKNGVQDVGLPIRVFYALALYLNGDENLAWEICNWSEEQIGPNPDTYVINPLSRDRENLGADLARAYASCVNTYSLSKRYLEKTIFDELIARTPENLYLRYSYGSYLFDANGAEHLHVVAVGSDEGLAVEAEIKLEEIRKSYRSRGLPVDF